jgi:hypothetical protein
VRRGQASAPVGINRPSPALPSPLVAAWRGGSCDGGRGACFSRGRGGGKKARGERPPPPRKKARPRDGIETWSGVDGRRAVVRRRGGGSRAWAWTPRLVWLPSPTRARQLFLFCVGMRSRRRHGTVAGAPCVARALGLGVYWYRHGQWITAACQCQRASGRGSSVLVLHVGQF